MEDWIYNVYIIWFFIFIIYGGFGKLSQPNSTSTWVGNDLIIVNVSTLVSWPKLLYIFEADNPVEEHKYITNKSWVDHVCNKESIVTFLLSVIFCLPEY